MKTEHIEGNLWRVKSDDGRVENFAIRDGQTIEEAIAEAAAADAAPPTPPPAPEDTPLMLEDLARLAIAQHTPAQIVAAKRARGTPL